MYLFSGYIKCLNCGGNFKGRHERKNDVYLCSTYARESTKCLRFVVHENDIIKIIEGHLKLRGLKIEEGKMKEALSEHLRYIEVDPIKKGYEIYYEDGLNSIVSNDDKLGIKYKL